MLAAVFSGQLIYYTITGKRLSITFFKLFKVFYSVTASTPRSLEALA